LLAIHFKKLKIIWSKNPAHTADIFWQLKRLYPEDADLNKIEKKGKQADFE